MKRCWRGLLGGLILGAAMMPGAPARAQDPTQGLSSTQAAPDPKQATFTAGVTTPGSNEYPYAGLTYVNSFATHDGEDRIGGAIDSSLGLAYFLDGTRAGYLIHSVKIGSPNEAPEVVATASTSLANEQYPHWLLYDQATQVCLVATGYVLDPRVVKFKVNRDNGNLTRVGHLNLPGPVLGFPIINSESGHVYFDTATPAQGHHLAKIAVGSDKNIPTYVSSLPLNQNEYAFKGVIHTGRKIAIFASGSKLIKIFLGEGDNPPTRIGELCLGPGEVIHETATPGTIDNSGGYAYFILTNNNILKIGLGERGEPPRRIGGIDIGSNQVDWLSSIAFISERNQLIVTGSLLAESRIFHFDAGEGDSSPRLLGFKAIGKLELSSQVFDVETKSLIVRDSFTKIAIGESPLDDTNVGTAEHKYPTNSLFQGGVIDESKGYLYFQSVSSFVKLQSGFNNIPPAFVAETKMGANEYNGLRGVIDSDRGYAYFDGSKNGVKHIYKVDLGEGSASPKIVGSVAAPGCNEMEIDTDRQLLFAAASNVIHKIACGAESMVPALLENISIDTGRITAMHCDKTTGYSMYSLETDLQSSFRIIKVNPGHDGSGMRIVNDLVDEELGHSYLSASSSQPGVAYFVAKRKSGNGSPIVVAKVVYGDGDSKPIIIARYHHNEVFRATKSTFNDLAQSFYIRDSSYMGRVSLIRPPNGVWSPLN